VLNRVLRKGQLAGQLLFRLATSGDRVLPSFLILGTMKGGTTSLFNFITEHPAVLPPWRKETNFFNHHYRKGALWYRAYFPRKSPPIAKANLRPFQTGEASPYYLYHPAVPRRVRNLLPDVKLIVLLRNPVERAFSHYRHQVRSGIESRPFAEVVDKQLQQTPATLLAARQRAVSRDLSHRRFSYLARGLYLEQIKSWHAQFPREQMILLQSEIFLSDTVEQFDRVLAFLELEPWRPAEGFPQYHVGIEGKIDTQLASRLRDFYHQPNEMLFEYLDQEFDW